MIFVKQTANTFEVVRTRDLKEGGAIDSRTYQQQRNQGGKRYQFEKYRIPKDDIEDQYGNELTNPGWPDDYGDVIAEELQYYDPHTKQSDNYWDTLNNWGINRTALNREFDMKVMTRKKTFA